jgi:hypothetical protein
MNLLQIIILTASLLLLCWITPGCARFPVDQTGTGSPSRTLSSQITVRGRINPGLYYFLAIDTDGDPSYGPVPVVTGPELGNGWVVIGPSRPTDPVRQPAFYLEYSPDTAGSPQQFRLNTDTNTYIPLGSPFKWQVSSDYTTLSVEIDESLLIASGQTSPTRIQINWITMDTKDLPPQDSGRIKQYDGLGPLGNDFFDIPQLDVAQHWSSGTGGVTEEPVYQEGEYTALNADLDIREWQAQTYIRQ